MQDKTGDKVFTKVKDKKDIHNLLAQELGERYRQYRQEWQQSESFFVERSFPLHMDIEMTNQCNMRCIMCEHGQLPKPLYFRKNKELDSDILCRTIEEAAAKGLRAINFNGINEPLLSSNLEKSIRLAKDKGIIDLFLHTNAILLTPERAKSLIKAGLTRIFFSLDGFSKRTYSKVRIGGNFQNVLKNIENFIAIREQMGKRIPITGVCFVTLPVNKHEMESFVEFWQKRVDFIAIQEYIKIPNHIFSKEKVEKKINFNCPMPWTRLVLNADGKISPCCTMYGRYLTLGDIYKDELETVWNSSRIKKLRQIHKAGKWYLNPVCKQCVEATF